MASDGVNYIGVTNVTKSFHLIPILRTWRECSESLRSKLGVNVMY